MKVYLATPYSHPSRYVRIKRFEAVNKVAADLMNQDFFVFSPISHTHPIAEAGKLPLDWKFWSDYDKSFIEWADEVRVLQLAGWKESKGVISEIKIAKSLGKPISYIGEGE